MLTDVNKNRRDLNKKINDVLKVIEIQEKQTLIRNGCQYSCWRFLVREVEYTLFYKTIMLNKFHEIKYISANKWGGAYVFFYKTTIMLIKTREILVL